MTIIKQSIRIIFRNKTYSLLNIAGLGVGIACAALILLWVEDEATFDKFPKSENLYYVLQNVTENTWNNTPTVLAAALRDDIAGVKRASRVLQATRYWGIDENAISGNGGFVDSMFFSMFDVRFILGNKDVAFNTEQSVVLSQSMAAKIFGNDNPVGQTLKMNERDYQVTGVYSDIKKNSSISFEWMVPVEVFTREIGAFMNPFQWQNSHLITVVELENNNVNTVAVNEQMSNLMAQRLNNPNRKLLLYPLNRMYLYGDFVDGVETGKGYITTIRTFAGIAFIILLIACINFMNLATARSQKRALEVGVRKTFGGSRLRLISQFLAESALITFLALTLAILVIAVSLPFYNTLIDKQLALNFGKIVHWGGLFGVGLICCLLAGSYPAFYLSSFPSIDMIRRLKTKHSAEVWFRKGLVVFQFSASLVLIICTMFIYLQIRHAKNRPLGLDIDQVMILDASDEIKRNFEPMKNSLLSTGVVGSVALSEFSLLQISGGWGNMNWPGKPDDFHQMMKVSMVTSGIISTLGLELVEGNRDFDDSMHAYGYMIINETLAEMMGEEGRVGGRLRQGGSMPYAEIIGVVKDFVFNDMYSVSNEPVILWYNPERTNNLLIRIQAPDTRAAVNRIGVVMNEFNPNSPFEYQFMDEQFNLLFHKELFTGKLALLFAALAIFISCLGLFGLTAFSVEQRTREIGVRKVLGASVWSIIQLLGRNFMLLIFISFGVAIPLASLLVQKWLDGFAYRMDISWTVFAAACLLVTLIAMLTVCALAWKAATENPVKALKSE